MTNGTISRDSLLSTLKSVKQGKSKKKSAAWFVSIVREHKVDFQITASDEKRIRENGDFLGRKGLDELIAAVRENYRPASSQQPPPATPTLEQPTFRPSGDEVLITVGSNTSIERTEKLKRGPFTVFRLDDTPVVIAYVERGKLYADVSIYDAPDRKVVQIKRNVFVVGMPSWDYNSNENAFEVVNQGGVPMFQLYYKTPSHIVINGVVQSSEGTVVYLTEAGMSDNPKTYNVKPIFKYPAWKYPGQYADDAPGPTPTPAIQNMINSPGGIQAGGNVTINQGPKQRSLTRQQRETFVKVLTAGPRGTVEIESPSDDSEAGTFAGEIANLFQMSGWQISAFARAQYPPASGPRGVEVGTFTWEQKPLAEIIKRAFEAVGYPVKMSSSQNDSPPPIVVAIGKMP